MQQRVGLQIGPSEVMTQATKIRIRYMSQIVYIGLWSERCPYNRPRTPDRPDIDLPGHLAPRTLALTDIQHFHELYSRS